MKLLQALKKELTLAVVRQMVMAEMKRRGIEAHLIEEEEIDKATAEIHEFLHERLSLTA